MPSQKGRDFLLKMGDGGAPEAFTSIGAARTNALVVNNNPVDDTAMGSNGVQTMVADAGVQTLQMNIDGLFKDQATEEALRAAAMDRTAHNFQLAFPNGDTYEAEFIVQDYNRSGSHDGLETFSASLIRSGAGTFTAAP